MPWVMHAPSPFRWFLHQHLWMCTCSVSLPILCVWAWWAGPWNPFQFLCFPSPEAPHSTLLKPQGEDLVTGWVCMRIVKKSMKQEQWLASCFCILDEGHLALPSHTNTWVCVGTSAICEGTAVLAGGQKSQGPISAPEANITCYGSKFLQLWAEAGGWPVPLGVSPSCGFAS